MPPSERRKLSKAWGRRVICSRLPRMTEISATSYLAASRASISMARRNGRWRSPGSRPRRQRTTFLGRASGPRLPRLHWAGYGPSAGPRLSVGSGRAAPRLLLLLAGFIGTGLGRGRRPVGRWCRDAEPWTPVDAGCRLVPLGAGKESFASKRDLRVDKGTISRPKVVRQTAVTKTKTSERSMRQLQRDAAANGRSWVRAGCTTCAAEVFIHVDWRRPLVMCKECRAKKQACLLSPA